VSYVETVNRQLGRIQELEHQLAAAEGRAESAEALNASLADERDEAVAEAESLERLVQHLPTDSHEDRRREPVAPPPRRNGRRSEDPYERRTARV
jgi:uncharacterized coiled-coil protein SlyX